MDSLLAGKLPPFQGTLPAIVMSSAAQPVEIIPGHRKSRSGAARKLFAFPPESLFVFSPESCSSSTGTLFAFTPESATNWAATVLSRFDSLLPGESGLCNNVPEASPRRHDGQAGMGVGNWRFPGFQPGMLSVLACILACKRVFLDKKYKRARLKSGLGSLSRFS